MNERARKTKQIAPIQQILLVNSADLDFIRYDEKDHGPWPVHPEGIHTWGNCFQNPRTQGGRAGCMSGRHNGRGRSISGGQGHFGGHGIGSHSNSHSSYPLAIRVLLCYF
jgi:hypothetical protein